VKSPAGEYLLKRGIPADQFNSYGSRRGNDEVMLRGTFANVRIKNKLASKEGGFTTYLPTGEELSVYDAAIKYKYDNIPLLILAGKEYGSGSSRDWAAKGTYLLGVKAVIAESYERIHRSNLIGMGVLPLQFLDGENYTSLGLTGQEFYDIPELNDSIKPLQHFYISATRSNGTSTIFEVACRLDSKVEIEYYRHSGILQYMLRQFLSS
jgi:aconitate hydratase